MAHTISISKLKPYGKPLSYKRYKTVSTCVGGTAAQFSILSGQLIIAVMKKARAVLLVLVTATLLTGKKEKRGWPMYQGEEQIDIRVYAVTVM